MTKKKIFNLAFPYFKELENIQIELINDKQMIYLIAYKETEFKGLKRYFLASFYNDFGLHLIYSDTNVIDSKIMRTEEEIKNRTRVYLSKLLNLI